MIARPLAIRILVSCLVLAGAGASAYVFTPWPKALLVRRAFERSSEAAQATLEKNAPDDVAVIEDLKYAAGADARLDVYFPARIAAGNALPTILWVHGGAWISGDNDYIASYLKNLAARGYTAVGLSYSLAPGARHPGPVRQTFEALRYLATEGKRLHIDPDRFVLAGDSAGAQIAAEAANVATSPEYARLEGIAPTIAPWTIKGMLLFSGVYDLQTIDFDGPFGDLMRTALWSYSGARDFRDNPAFASFSVARYVTAQFPATFITAGNVDPVASQSVDFARTLKASGVDVDELFFAADHTPALSHDYQFDLANPASRGALDRATAFLARVTLSRERPRASRADRHQVRQDQRRQKRADEHQ